MKLSELPNIGKDTEKLLNMVGIDSEELLNQYGSKEAWLKLKKIDPSACINRLYGLEAAIEGIKKKDLSQDKKNELKEFYNLHK